MPPKPAPPKPGARAPAKTTPAAKKPPATGAKTPAKPAAKGAAKPAAGKGNAAVGAKKQTEPAKPKERVWTKQDDAARTIQTKARQYLARKQLQKMKKEKEDYEEIMQKLEREAYVKMVEKFREEAEREREKEEEERRRKKKERERVKKMLESAFDGDEAEIMNLIKEVEKEDGHLGTDPISKGLKLKHMDALINCEDANQNTPLSEAASGGHASTIKMLIERGADVNTQGQFLRTPLYRAAFAGHIEAAEVLLQYGADPDIYASDGAKPAEISSMDSIKQLLETWDRSITDSMLARIKEEKEKKLAIEKEQKEAEMAKLENQIKEAEKEYSAQELRLSSLYTELNKRIHEHDTAEGAGFDKPELTLQSIHDAEADLEIAKIDFEKARDKLAQLRLKRREQERTNEGLTDDDLPGVKVAIRELEEVLLRDVGNKIQDSGRWPLIIDPSGQVSTFLRYQDTNYINALKPNDMEPDKIRMSLLGSIRYGKPCVLDMMEIDLWESSVRRFDEVLPNLMDLIMSKDIMKEEVYKKLIKQPQDGPHYELKNFRVDRTERFRMFFLSKNPYPSEEVVDKSYLLRVHIPT